MADSVPVKETKPTSKLEPDTKLIHLHGLDGLATRLAKCCNPTQDDKITGYISQTRGIYIHKSDCKNMLRKSGDQLKRIIDASWGIASDD